MTPIAHKHVCRDQRTDGPSLGSYLCSGCASMSTSCMSGLSCTQQSDRACTLCTRTISAIQPDHPARASLLDTKGILQAMQHRGRVQQQSNHSPHRQSENFCSCNGFSNN